MPDIEPVKQEFDEAVKTKDDNEKDLSDSHEASILYQQDVVSTENTINEIKSVGQEASDSCSKCAGFAATATSTGVKDCESSLASLSGSITTSTDSLQTDVYEKIKTASLEVYEEKKGIYDTYNNQSNEYISKFEEDKATFYEQKSIYETAKATYDSLSDKDDEEKKEKAKREMTDAMQQMKAMVSACKTYVRLIEANNDKNRELLDQFLKTS